VEQASGTSAGPPGPPNMVGLRSQAHLAHPTAAEDDDAAAEAEPLSDELVEVIRKVLSGVARTRGRFGKQIVAQMLCGSASAKMKRFGLQRLSTYGLLGHFKQDEVGELIDALLTVRCLEQGGDNPLRPTLRLTDFGTSVMTDQIRLNGRIDLSPALASRFPVSRPRTPSVAKADTDRPQRPPSEPSQAGNREAEPAVSGASAGRPRHYWTIQLLQRGFSVEECMEVRGYDREVVFDHIVRAADEGCAVDMRWLLSQEAIEKLAQVIGPDEPASIRALLAKLPGLRYEEVQLYLKCRAKAPPSPEGA
ncbi:MAG: RQC domain-containing protein, partial [Pirellulales bacterium]